MPSARFSVELIHWRGPAPFWFAPVPPAFAEEIDAIAGEVSYGWGVIPATVRIGVTEWTTSLFPKDGGYLVPIKTAVRRAEGIADADVVTLELTVGG